MPDHDPELTRMLQSLAEGEDADVDALMSAIYQDLRHLALRHLRSERRDHTLQPTALVHEAYLRLIDQRATDWRNRLHFFAVASRIIRRILVDHARSRGAIKRGGGQARVSLNDLPPTLEPAADGTGLDMLGLDEALAELSELDSRQAEIVELRFFGGLTAEEVARHLDLSSRTVEREWRLAKAWLFDRLSESIDDDV